MAKGWSKFSGTEQEQILAIVAEFTGSYHGEDFPGRSVVPFGDEHGFTSSGSRRYPGNRTSGSNNVPKLYTVQKKYRR